jgi:hypothetical protein
LHVFINSEETKFRIYRNGDKRLANKLFDKEKKVQYTDDLFLYEEIMLLALKDEEGTVAAGTMYNYAVAGAIIAELLLSHNIVIDQIRKQNFISVVNAGQLNCSLIDEWLFKMSVSEKRKTIQYWVALIANTSNLKHKVATQLCQRGILKMDEETILLMFTRKIYPQINSQPERLIIDRLKKTIFTDTDDVDARTVALLALAKSSNILPAIFGKDELKPRKERIERILNGETSGKSSRESLKATVMIASVMPTIMSTRISISTDYNCQANSATLLRWPRTCSCSHLPKCG